jgi:hypothetical protein
MFHLTTPIVNFFFVVVYGKVVEFLGDFSKLIVNFRLIVFFQKIRKIRKFGMIVKR